MVGFPTESALETLLEQSPFLLPWDLTEGLVLASQAYLPPAGPANLIGVGVSGEIVLVGYRLRNDAERRRDRESAYGSRGTRIARRIHQRRKATPDHTSSTTPNG